MALKKGSRSQRNFGLKASRFKGLAIGCRMQELEISGFKGLRM